MSSMLQIPNTSQLLVGSLPPSQTATLVGPMAAEIANEPQQDWDESSPQMAEAQAGAPIATILPKVSITFLLGSGKRKTLDFEQSDSFAGIKERLAREWPTEWEGEVKPQNASAIRLLHLGRLIPDEESLSANTRFTPTHPTIVHLSVRPFTARQPSATGSLKAKTTLLRTGGTFPFSGRGNAPSVGSPTTGVATAGSAGASQPLDSVQEQQESRCCCVIC